MAWLKNEEKIFPSVCLEDKKGEKTLEKSIEIDLK